MNVNTRVVPGRTYPPASRRLKLTVGDATTVLLAAGFISTLLVAPDGNPDAPIPTSGLLGIAATSLLAGVVGGLLIFRWNRRIMFESDGNHITVVNSYRTYRIAVSEVRLVGIGRVSFVRCPILETWSGKRIQIAALRPHDAVLARTLPDEYGNVPGERRRWGPHPDPL